MASQPLATGDLVVGARANVLAAPRYTVYMHSILNSPLPIPFDAAVQVLPLPLAWVLCRQFGPVGVWNAFWATEVLSAIVSLIVYKKSV